MIPCSSSLFKSCTSTRPLSRISRRVSSPVAAHPSAVWLGKRWAEFHGAGNWDGLLDPLNPTLCFEILRYGGFVQAAYSCFDLDPSSPIHRLPYPGYRVTRTLHATSGTSLPCWAAAAFPCSLSRQSSWIGFVAVCEDDSELARLGRHDIVVALRGTVTFLEWLDNLRATLTSAAPSAPISPSPVHKPMVESGFWSLFTSPAPGNSLPCLRDQIRDEIRRLLRRYAGGGGPVISITITGHSLGAALAVLAADDITAILGGAAPVTVVSFGGPRVGNAGFRRRIEEQGIKVLRIVNTRDIITRVPGFLEDQDGLCSNWLLAKTGWVYADIGRELRVRSRRTANVAACHDLRHYLQLVNQLNDASSLAPEEENVSSNEWWWRCPEIMASNGFEYNVSNSCLQYD